MTHSDFLPVPEPRIARFESFCYGFYVGLGLYSLMGEGEWIQNFRSIPCEEYAKLAGKFDASEFDAREWARLARESGARYVCFCTRHHDGFSLYDTKGLSDFDAPHSPAGRDLVAEFAEACRSENIVPFFYHTLLDWRWESQSCPPGKFTEYLDYLHSSVELLCRNYGEVGGFWFDGSWSRTDGDWKEDRLYGMIRKLQPEAMIIDNSGLNARGARGQPEVVLRLPDADVRRHARRLGRAVSRVPVAVCVCVCVCTCSC